MRLVRLWWWMREQYEWYVWGLRASIRLKLCDLRERLPEHEFKDPYVYEGD